MFNADIKQFKTVAEFESHIKMLALPDWTKGVVIHHTWKPVPTDWRGEKTMNALKKYYEGLTWNAGPHLFICIGSPNPADDGIWQLTPLNAKGIHAGECNNTTWGVEIVGNYDLAPWSKELKKLVYETLAVLLQKINVKSVVKAVLRGHRECNSPKTCPGSKIDMDVVRNEMQQVLFPSSHIVSRESTIVHAPRCTIENAVNYLKNKNGWYTENELSTIIVPAYFRYGQEMGIDPCIAIAQLVHETGFLTSWWSNRPRRNPAGIGVTGQTSNTPPNDDKNWAYNPQNQKWHKGLSFASWENNAVPSHIARLFVYSVPSQFWTKVQTEFVAKYTADRPVPPKFMGCAPTLAGLEGTWAFPGKGYADKLALHANGIIRA